MNNYPLILITFCTSVIFSCTTKQAHYAAHIQDPQVRTVLERAIGVSGGWENYQSIDSIIYKKKTILYHQDGTIESELAQEHKYQLSPAISGDIYWADSIGSHHIRYDGKSSYKSLNGQVLNGQGESAKSAFMSAYYVLFIPFKLMDEGVVLAYEGVETVINGETCDVIKATYAPDEHQNHSTADVWYYYFDTETGRYVSSMVYHAPTYAYISNDQTTSEQAIIFNTYRKSYRTDAERNIEYLRGEFWYSDYRLVTH